MPYFFASVCWPTLIKVIPILKDLVCTFKSGSSIHFFKRQKISLIRKTRTLLSLGEGLPNRIYDDSDSKPSEFECRFWSDLKSDDEIVSYPIVFLIKINLFSIKFDLF